VCREAIIGNNYSLNAVTEMGWNCLALNQPKLSNLEEKIYAGCLGGNMIVLGGFAHHYFVGKQ